MGERHQPDAIEFDRKQKQAADNIANDALHIVDKTYSSGYPHFRGGRRALAYHNGHHARSVAEDGAKVAESLGLSSGEIKTAYMAGAAHDIVQLRGRGTDERESAEWLEQEVRKRDIFPEAVARIGALAILGTEPLFVRGIVKDQRANRLKYPSKLAEKIAKSVASGDLGELFKPLGPYLGHLYHLELEHKSAKRKPKLDISKLAAFQRNQIEMIEGYTYPIRKAGSILATHRSQVTRYSYRVLEQLERGDISSWDQLLAQDLQFMRRPR